MFRSRQVVEVACQGLADADVFGRGRAGNSTCGGGGSGGWRCSNGRGGHATAVVHARIRGAGSRAIAEIGSEAIDRCRFRAARVDDVKGEAGTLSTGRVRAG